MNTLSIPIGENSARVATPHEAPWEREPEPCKADVADRLNVLADNYQYDRDGRNAGALAVNLIDMDFLVDMPLDALLEILRHAAKSASLEWQHTRKHLVDLLEEME